MTRLTVLNGSRQYVVAHYGAGRCLELNPRSSLDLDVDGDPIATAEQLMRNPWLGVVVHPEPAAAECTTTGDISPAEPAFDAAAHRRTYMRDYMRRKRARLKAGE